ncbi:hypothetical protein GGR51DRAFT_530387 [Nemania sp. FL0031]|nr:hypothetical protein GGR51DRAFT_530387 [Nemania sp. FL0031]
MTYLACGDIFGCLCYTRQVIMIGESLNGDTGICTRQKFAVTEASCVIMHLSQWPDTTESLGRGTTAGLNLTLTYLIAIGVNARLHTPRTHRR